MSVMSPDTRAAIACEMRQLADLVDSGECTSLEYVITKVDHGLGEWRIQVAGPIRTLVDRP